MDFVLAFPEQLGLHLKSLRKGAGLRQAELAALLGVSQSRVAAIEKDPSAVSVGQFLAILKLLDAELVIRRNAMKHEQPAHAPIAGQEMLTSTAATDLAQVDEAVLTPVSGARSASSNVVDQNSSIQPLEGLGAGRLAQHMAELMPKRRGIGTHLSPSVLAQLKRQGILDEDGNPVERSLGLTVAKPKPRGIGAHLSPSVLAQLKRQGILDEDGNPVERSLGLTVAKPKPRGIGAHLSPSVLAQLKRQGILDEDGNPVERSLGLTVAKPKPRGIGGLLSQSLLEQLKKQGILDEDGNPVERSRLKPQVLSSNWQSKKPKGSW